MSLSSDARINHEAFKTKFFNAIDAMDGQAFIECFADNASFTFANNPPASGHAQIRGLGEGMFNMFASLTHEFIGVHSVSDSTFSLFL